MKIKCSQTLRMILRRQRRLVKTGAYNHIIRTKKWNPCRKYEGMFATGPIACAAALAPRTASTPPHHAKYVFFPGNVRLLPKEEHSSDFRCDPRCSRRESGAVLYNYGKYPTGDAPRPPGRSRRYDRLAAFRRAPRKQRTDARSPSLNRSDHPQQKTRSTIRIPQGGLKL